MFMSYQASDFDMFVAQRKDELAQKLYFQNYEELCSKRKDAIDSLIMSEFDKSCSG